MKTKHYLYTLALACMSLGSTSCTDILDVEPLNSFSDEAIWSDLALSETYLNAQYVNLWAETMKGTRFAHFTDEVYQKHTYGSENVTQGLLNCDTYSIGWDETMWDPWGTYYGYIKSISGLGEFDCGAQSGWLYKVNGVRPSISTRYYTLKPGDRVELIYTCKQGDVS